MDSRLAAPRQQGGAVSRRGHPDTAAEIPAAQELPDPQDGGLRGRPLVVRRDRGAPPGGPPGPWGAAGLRSGAPQGSALGPLLSAGDVFPLGSVSLRVADALQIYLHVQTQSTVSPPELNCLHVGDEPPQSEQESDRND